MIDLSKVNSIAHSLYQELLNWGVSGDSFQIENKDTPVFVRKTMTAHKDGLSFRVVLYVTEDNDAYLAMNQLWHTSLKWDLRIIYFIKNSNKIELSIQKEHLKQKIGKLFGKNDLEVYNNQFDKTFLINSNHPYAYATILDENLQQKLLAQSEHFSQYLVRGDQVRYHTTSAFDLLEKEETHFTNLMEIGWLLAKNIQDWQSPQ